MITSPWKTGAERRASDADSSGSEAVGEGQGALHCRTFPPSLALLRRTTNP
jgi:hypothetical protein